MVDHARLPATASLRARWRGLIPQLFIFVVLPLTLVLIAIALGSLTLHQAAMRALVGERDARSARASASSIEAALQQRAGEVTWLAQRVVDGIEPNVVLAGTGPTESGFGLGIAIVDKTGRSLAVSGLFANTQGTVPGGLRQLQAEAHRVGVSPVFWVLASSEGQAPLMIVAVRRADVVAAGAFRPADVAADAFGQALGTSDTMSAYLVDQDTQLVYHVGSAPTPGHLTNHPGIMEALAGRSGTTFMPGEDGEHVIAYSTIPSLNWALVIEEPWHSVDNPLLRTTQTAPLVLAPIAVLSLVALWFGWR